MHVALHVLFLNSRNKIESAIFIFSCVSCFQRIRPFRLYLKKETNSMVKQFDHDISDITAAAVITTEEMANRYADLSDSGLRPRIEHS